MSDLLSRLLQCPRFSPGFHGQPIAKRDFADQLLSADTALEGIDAPYSFIGLENQQAERVQAESLFLGCWTGPKSPWVVLASGMRIVALTACVRF